MRRDSREVTWEVGWVLLSPHPQPLLFLSRFPDAIPVGAASRGQVGVRVTLRA